MEEEAKTVVDGNFGRFRNYDEKSIHFRSCLGYVNS